MPTDTAPITDAELAGARQIAPFVEFEERARQLVATAKEIAALDPDDPKSAKRAREMRLTIKPFRVVIEKRHADLKRPVLDRGNQIDDAKNALLEILKPLEADLLAIEQHVERVEQQRLAALKAEREEQLRPFVLVNMKHFNLVDMPAEEFATFLADCQQQTRERAERAVRDRVEQERIAADEKKKAEEQVADNERLRKQAAADRAERERVEHEAAEQRQKAEAAARVEREAREKAEKALQDARAAQEEKERAASAAKLKADLDHIAEEEAAQKAPDKEKIRALAEVIRNLPVPPMSTHAGEAAVVEIAWQITKFAAWLVKKSDTL